MNIEDILAQSEIEDEISQLRMTTFHETMKNILEYKNWNTTKFADKTYLSKMTYTHARRKHNFELRIIITMCVALDLNMMTTDYLLKLQGLALDMEKDEHRAYNFLIENFKGKDIEECNAYLKAKNIDEKHFLGTISKK